MIGREQIAIARHVPLSVLKKRIKHHQGLPKDVPHLVFVQLRYTGMSAVQAAEAVGVSGYLTRFTAAPIVSADWRLGDWHEVGEESEGAPHRTPSRPFHSRTSRA